PPPARAVQGLSGNHPPCWQDCPAEPELGSRGAGLSEQLRLMCVHAHPDDESSKGAAAMARYISEGVDVLVVSCTGGERGDILNPALKNDPALLRDMPEVR